MLDINQKLNELLQNNETEILEFKEAKNDFDFRKLGKYFSALSNEANLLGKSEAWLVFGVRDDKKIVGTDYRRSSKSLQSLKNELANKTSNRITFKEIYEVLVEDKRVIFFKIPSAPKGMPIAFEGHYYGRDGESINALNIEEIESIRTQGIEEDWSIQICEGATIDDLSLEAIVKAREFYVKKNPHLRDEMSAWDNVTFLNKAKITIAGMITRTAILLLGKSESEHYLSPAVAKISWILKDRDNIAKDYEHFYCPFLLSVNAVFNKIRNLKYRYLMDGTLFPEEVDSYDPYIIREALNNCIAHQDYALGGKINVVENEESQLIFLNSGSFTPKTIENVLNSDAPNEKYRNKFLAEAMVNLKMIDTIGSGISTMFRIQKDKFFPLPEYSFENKSVKVVIEGKILDINYAKKLAQMPTLDLNQIILLDKVQKGKDLTATEAKLLKSQKLVEGKRPNLHISSQVAKHTHQEEDYIKLRGIDDAYAKKMMIDYLNEFEKAKRSDFFRVLVDKLPDILKTNQKENKIKNYLQELRKDGIIESDGKYWIMAKK